jgi:AraC-like DNA-binding protein
MLMSSGLGVVVLEASISRESRWFNDLDARIFARDTHRVDLLQEHLVRARAAGGVFARSAANPPWGLRLSGIQLAVHAVVQGQIWLWTEAGEAPVVLRPGDLAFVRGGPDHFVAYEPGAECVSPDEFRRLHTGGEVELGADGAVFLCGAYQFAGDIGAGLVDALPPVLAFPASVDDPIHGVVTLLSRELAQPQPAQQTVLDRLLDLLVVLGLRTGLARSANAPAWFRASADERLARALQAIHENAGRPWTVEGLARVALMSRASFARVFQQTLGQTPMQYLRDWRMTLARDLLLTDGVSLSEIAARVGYSSQYAFTTAFRRHHGQPPGRWRESHALDPSAVLIVH